MEITIKEPGDKGFALAKSDGKKAGLMTYTIPNAYFIIIDHTEVEPEYRGLDVGKKLLYKIVEMAREKDRKILPLCPFAHAMFKKNNDIQDVLKS